MTSLFASDITHCMRKNISSGSYLEDPIGFSRAVRICNIIAVSGTAPIPDEKFTGSLESVYDQTKLCLAITKKSIEEAGGKITDTLRTRIMLTDISKWKEAARAHGEFFGSIKPACTFVEVKGFIDPSWLVETEADCYVVE